MHIAPYIMPTMDYNHHCFHKNINVVVDMVLWKAKEDEKWIKETTVEGN